VPRFLVNLSYRGIRHGRGLHDRLPGQQRAKPARAGSTS
jgi:ribosomal protein S13